MILADFASEYGIRLHRDNSVMWPEFITYLRGLLSAETRLSRRFAPRAREPMDGGDESV